MLESRISPAQIVVQNATLSQILAQNNDRNALSWTLHHDICIQVPIQLLNCMLMVTPGGGVLQISSDGDDRRIFMGLKISTPGFFWVGKFEKYFSLCVARFN